MARKSAVRGGGGRVEKAFEVIEENCRRFMFSMHTGEEPGPCEYCDATRKAIDTLREALFHPPKAQSRSR